MTHPTITTSKGRYVLVEVPEDARDFRIWEDQPYYLYFFTAFGWDGQDMIELSSASIYTPLFTTKNATEEDARGVVDDKPDGKFRNHLYHTIQAPHIWKDTALESLHSLLIANGLDVNKNYLIIKTDQK